MDEEKFTEYLTQEQRKAAVHIGDGAYVIQGGRGYAAEIFASNGIAKTPSVFLDENAIHQLHKLIV